MASSTIQFSIGGRYQVVGRIASGGMGEVYRAHDAVLAREVAVKLLHPQFAHDRGFIERFRREARAAAILNHPNIVGVFDWGSTGRTYYMVMEYVPGTNLRALLTDRGRLDPSQVVEVSAQVLSALDHAHGHGIVHRDVKPENILLTRDGVVKVTDFGLARAFAEASISQAEGTVTGTVQYLAPEQIQGEPADPRTDLYALGVVMFECLTGRSPFTGETSLAIAYQHLSSRVPPPSTIVPTVPPVLDRSVLHATEPKRADRPSTARAMRDEVTRAGINLNGTPSLADLARDLPAAVEAGGPERAETVTIARPDAPKARRRRTGRRLFWTVLVLALLAVGGWAAWTYAVPHYVAIPHVTGLSMKSAEARLDAAGFHWSVSPTGVPSVDVRVGSVAKTSPPVDSRARTGSTITLYPSTGPPIEQVPPVTGLGRTDAVAKLTAAGFTNVKVVQRFSDTIDKGQAIGTQPAAQQRMRVTDLLQLLISKGPPPVPIPTLTNQPLDQALKYLKSLGLKTTVEKQFSVDVLKGDVITTKPPPGHKVPAGGTVTVIASKGPRTFPMPDVLGESVATATAQLERLGLQVQVAVIGSGSGIVVGESPSVGSTVHEGQQVTLYVVQ